MELLAAIAVIALSSGMLLLAILQIELNYRVGLLEEQVMGLAEELLAIKDQADKARAEITAKLDSLEAAVLAQPLGPDPAVLQAVAALKESVQSLDDVVPDAPADQPADQPLVDPVDPPTSDPAA